MLLYDHPLSPYAQKVRIMLREKGLAFTREVPEALGSGQITGFASHNPRMEVPALVTEGRTLCGSSIILDFLEDRYRERPLLPEDPFARAHGRETEEICDTLYEANNWGLLEIRVFGRGGELSDELEANAGEEIAVLNGWLERRLSPSGWLSGESFGRADLAAIPYVSTASLLGFMPTTGSHLADWVERTGARASVAETLAEGEAAFKAMGQYAHALESGAMRRHYRDHRLEWTLRVGGLPVVLDGLANNNIRFTDLSLFAE